MNRSERISQPEVPRRQFLLWAWGAAMVALAGQAGLSGSTRLGRFVQMGGQAGTAGHLYVGDGARVGGQTGITNDLDGGVTVAGTPPIEIALWRRVATVLPRLPELLRRVRALEKKLGIG